MTNSNINYGCSLGFVGALTLMFVASKLFGIFAWPWLLVFSPIWIVAGFYAAIIVILFVVTLVRVKNRERDSK